MDGANVNVDVAREEKIDVITVPVAAVLQDGQGNDVVRVVLTDGTTRQVQVKVGLLKVLTLRSQKAQAKNLYW